MKKLLSVIIVIIALVIALGMFNFGVSALKTGDPMGDVLYSNIVAYIHGCAIPTSVIKGKTLVVVEDLANYGFDVRWNGTARTLKVEPNEKKSISPLYVEKNYKPAGSVKTKYLYTDIKTYLSGDLVESYAINGVTLIDFELLAKYGDISWNGALKELRFTVPVKSVALDTAKKTINRYESFTLNAFISPANATDKNIMYKSSNPNVATVSNYGTVYAAGAGSATITAVSNNGIKAYCEVKVIVPVSYISVETERYRYKTGETAGFKVVVYPEDATDKNYTVNITGSGVLSGDGKIYCPSGGITAITATATSNGVSGKKEIEIVDLNEYAAEVLRLTNIERAKQGRSELSGENYLLNAAAMLRATELITSYSHTRPDGRSQKTAYEDLGGTYTGYYIGTGENIYMGPDTPQYAVDGWMNSSGHKNNILNSSYTHMGVGVAMDDRGGLYWVQMFVG